MRLLNTKNPEDVAKIFPWLLPTESETRMDIANELYGRLKENPDDILFMIAIERNITRAVLIAYMTDNKRVWLWQSNAEAGFRHSKLMFDSLKNWSKIKGAKEIRMRTGRNKNAFQRKWNFEPLKNGDMRLKIA